MSSRTITDVNAVQGDECSCGRRASVLHCTSCGSTRVYARQNRIHKMLDGSDKLVEKQFRCQRCGHIFIEEERTSCEAPPVTAKLAQQRANVLAAELHRTNPERAREILLGGSGDAGAALKEQEQAIARGPEQGSTEEEIIALQERKLRQEWVDAKLLGKAFKMNVEQYVQARLRGEQVE